MDVVLNKLWVTRLKESTSIELIRDIFSTNASRVLRVTMLSGGSAVVHFATEAAARTAQQDVKKVDGRQVMIEPYSDSLFNEALPDEAAKIKVPRSECMILLDQDKKYLISLSHKHSVCWTEDTIESLHLYCNPARANVVLGEINNIKKMVNKTVRDKPNIKPVSPKDTSSTAFGMTLAQTAMPNNTESVLVQQNIGILPNGKEEGYVITSHTSGASALPPPAPPIDDDLKLAQCKVTRLRTADQDTVDKMTEQFSHQTIGSMEIKIKDELLQYLTKHKAKELKNIEDKSDVLIAKHPGKVVLSVKPNFYGKTNESISLAYSDFLQLYNDTQSSVKFVNLDVRPLNLSESSIESALQKVESTYPTVMIFNKVKVDGHLTLVGPEDDLKKGIVLLPSTNKVNLGATSGKRGEVPSDFKKEVKGKDAYSYFGDLTKMNTQKVYSYRDSRSGITVIVKNGILNEEEVDGVIQYCDTKGKVLSLATGTGRAAKIGAQTLGATAVNITNQTIKNAQVLHSCVSDGFLSRNNMENGLKSALSTCSQMKHKILALPPLATGKSTSDLAAFMEAFMEAFRDLTSKEGANSSVKEIRLVTKDPLAVEVLSDRFDNEFIRISGPLSQKSRGSSPATKSSWGSQLKKLASPENK